jgi:hypothetical protein
VEAAKRTAALERSAADRMHDEQLAAMRREHALQLAANDRARELAIEQQRQVTEATLSARERQHEQEMSDAREVHRDKLAAYQKIEQQGGTLHALAAEVGASTASLNALRERMEKELWKSVLNQEAVMLKKEGALNEVQRQREQLWADREGIVRPARAKPAAVSGSRAPSLLSTGLTLGVRAAAGERHPAAAGGREGADARRVGGLEARVGRAEGAAQRAAGEPHRGWRRRPARVAARAPPSTACSLLPLCLQVGLSQRRLDAEKLHEGVARESGTLLTELQAERRLLAGERDICRSERTALSKCLIEHRTEVSRHRDDVFHKMQELASAREQHTRHAVDTSAQLEVAKHTVSLERRSVEFEKSVAAKERARVGKYMQPLQHEQEVAERERERLKEASQLIDQRSAQVGAPAFDGRTCN